MASNRGVSIPGGWGGRDTPRSGLPAYSDADVSEHDLAAGVVGDSGEVLNQSGQSVGKVTEGDVKDLVGNVVTASGDIVDKSGDVVGRATPLEGDSSKSPGATPKKGGWTVMGTVKSVNNIVGNVDNTAQTIGKLAPAAGQLNKSLQGLGSKSTQAQTEDAGDATSETGDDAQAHDQTDADDTPKGPVSLEDNDDPDADAPTGDDGPIDADSDEKWTEVDGSQVPEGEAPEAADIDDEQSQVPTEAQDQAEGATEEEAPEGAEDAASEGQKTEGLTADTPRTDDVPQSQLGDEANPEDHAGQEDVPQEGQSQVQDTQAPVGAQDFAGDSQSQVPAKTAKSGSVAGTAKLPEEEKPDPLASPFGQYEGAEVGQDGKIFHDDKSVGRVVEGEAADLVGMKLDSQGNIMNEKGSIVGKASLKTELKEELLKAHDAEQKPFDTLTHLTSPFEAFEGAVIGEDGRVMLDDKSIGHIAEGDPAEMQGLPIDSKGNVFNDNGSIIGKAELKPDINKELLDNKNAERAAAADDNKSTKTTGTRKTGKTGTTSWKSLGNLTSPFAKFENAVVGEDGRIMVDDESVGQVVEGEIEDLVGLQVDPKGNILNEEGEVVGRAELKPEIKKQLQKEKRDFDTLTSPFEKFEGAIVGEDGRVMFDDQSIGKVVEGDLEALKGALVDVKGNIINENGSIIGKAELKENIYEELKAEKQKRILAFAALKGCKLNKSGNVVNEKGEVVGRLVEGILKQLIGKKCDENGQFWNDAGQVIGRAEPIPEKEREEFKAPSPFEDFPDAIVQSNGDVTSGGEVIGKVVEGDPHELKGKHVDEDGDILDRNGNVIGRAERWEAPEAEPEKEMDRSMLAGLRVNKSGNLVNDKGEVIGRVTEGVLKNLIGKTCDENGYFYNDAGHKIGRAEPISESEKSQYKAPSPFEDFPDAVVQSNGDVTTGDGEVIGKVVEGDPKKLKGKKVDEDGDILDRNGNVLGKAERWEEPEAEPEPEKDRSILAGKRVNKAGNVVDSSGVIYGRVIEGDIKRMVNRMCDKDGNVRSEAGDIIGKADVVTEGEREGFKDGPFAELPGCTVTKDGKVVTPGGDVVGRLVTGDPKVLFGRSVDEDGDVLDRNGNAIGKAERWEEPEIEKKRGPLAGRRVNREGNVVDDDGNIIGRLTTGEITICSGKEIDDDGDVVNAKGQTVGHASTLEEIPPEIEEESPEEIAAREQADEDAKLAKQIAFTVEQSLDRIRPICKMITQKIEKAERTPKEELDEEELVKQVKPLIEEGGRILQEANGAIRGLDPDGRIQANAKHKTATREATPEEYHLADVLKELTGTVTETIEHAQRVLEDMPHAKKELSPLWGLLNEPLFQILAAVGLLLNGVLSLVGRLLRGLGLGGILDNLLGTLGLNRLLEGFGVGSVMDAFKGKKKK